MNGAGIMKTLRNRIPSLLLGMALFGLTPLVSAVPSVSLTAPAANAVFAAPGTVALAATATPSSGTTITKVDFYRGTTLIGSDTTVPYSVTWSNAPAGTYSLTAKATDNKNKSTTSTAISIVVDTPPTASLTAPAANMVFTAGSAIPLTATAADSDGTVAKVEFYRGSTLIGTATAAPYTVTWSNAPAGSVSLTAKATDNKGIATTSTAIPIIVNAAPTVAIGSPGANQTFTTPANITLTASAADSDGTVAKVDFYQGSTLIGTATASPYTVTWNSAPSGAYVLTAKATDNRGAIATSAAVPIFIDVPPTVTLTSPLANTVFPAGSPIPLTANAADSDGTVAKVEFYQGATLVGTATAAPYSATWSNAPAGTYSLTARATDNSGAVTTTPVVTIVVNALPTVSLTSPTPGQALTAPANVTITANASDSDGTITKVDFYQGGTLIGSVASAPYSLAWADVPAGTYSLTAQATDNRGALGTSVPLSVTVGANGVAVYYLHTDHLNTPRLVMDEQNVVVWRSLPLAEPFGNSPPEEDPDGNGVPFSMNLRFPGQYADQETNLNQNTFRDYNPQLGRYIQSDPIGLRGGINTYGYVGGNPLSRTDPRGLDNPGMGPYGQCWSGACGAASGQVGKGGYGYFDPNSEARGRLRSLTGGVPSEKCNKFVWDQLENGGAPAGRMPDGRIPSAGEWGNPNSGIPNYSPVPAGTPFAPGDVVSDGGHVGIYAPLADGSPGTVSAAFPFSGGTGMNGGVVNNDWGFRPGQTVTGWRRNGSP